MKSCLTGLKEKSQWNGYLSGLVEKAQMKGCLTGRKEKSQMKGCLTALCLLLSSLLVPGVALAHHGVASLGAAGLEGPGAPIETSSSATLPKGSGLTYLKVDHADFEKFTDARDDETDHYTFWMFGLGYGLTSWFSGYVFLPYNVKVLEDNSFNTSDFADISLMGVLGFNYDAGLKLVPENESLDDMEDWHFTTYGGLSLPTGDANVRDSKGNIDPGLSTGFGEPTFSAGVTATKPISNRLTLANEVSYIYFLEYSYHDGNRTQFGDEFRANTALSCRLLTAPESKLRLDANLEANYLKLGRDETNGVGELATGGHILYVVPGVRSYWKNMSAGLGVKLPAWTDLNEEDDQQGAEGKENYRLILTVSALFSVF